MRNAPIYGVLAEFDGPIELTKAAEKAYAAGFRHMDAYSPFPIEEVSEAIGFHRSKLPVIAAGGIFDAASAREKFAAGAKLIQLYTGYIYRGPGLIREIINALPDWERRL